MSYSYNELFVNANNRMIIKSKVIVFINMVNIYFTILKCIF